jgi:hypothetical protein
MNTASGPTVAHKLAVEEGARHHAESKTYSGSLMRPHVPYLSEMISRLGVRSALDYGCGKGEQYRWRDPHHANQTVEERWGFTVTKYDPCYPPYAAEPKGKFDLVVCTHTISLIPLVDLDWALGRLFGFASKAVFIAEKIGSGKRKKGEIADPTERAIGWTVNQWLDRIAPFADERPDLETVFSSREKLGGATITTRHRRTRDGWHSEVAGPR